MSDSKVCVLEKTSGEKLWSYLERNPSDFDVTFCVGPKKEIVKGVKILLKSASSMLGKEFNEKWECAVSNKTEGIPLPDFDPKAFQLFMKQLILDTWSADALQNLNLPPEDMLNLLKVCRHFGITTAVKNLEAQSEVFIRDFQSFVSTDEFLRMSQANLETVVSSDSLLMEEKDLFEALCKWAEFKCQENNIKATRDNIRLVLGGCLFQIRFPIMSNTDFRRIRLQNVLSAEERLAIYDFIALTEQEKQSFDSSELSFKTQARTAVSIKLPTHAFHPNCLTLSLSEDQIIDVATPFQCDGSEAMIELKPNQNISLHGIGFLGPIDADANYDVTVEIKRLPQGRRNYPYHLWHTRTIVYGKQQKQISALKAKPFYYIFDDPVVLQLNAQPHNDSGYKLCYSLQGTPTPQYERAYGMNQQVGGVTFTSIFETGHQPISEIIFQKV